jgi:hypothetical protein
MGMYDAPQNLHTISRALKVKMLRIKYLVHRYGIKADGTDDRGHATHWLADVSDALEKDNRRIFQARADWAARNPSPRY